MTGKEKEEKPRNWDRELAEVDKLLAKLPDPGPHPGSAPPVRRPATPGGGAVRAAVASGAGWLRTWVLVGVGGALGLGVWQWPYAHGCGAQLLFYLIGVSSVIVAGVWSAVSSWRRRLGVAHVLALLVTLWGLVLASREVLPRTGYAEHPQPLFCREPRPGK